MYEYDVDNSMLFELLNPLMNNSHYSLVYIKWGIPKLFTTGIKVWKCNKLPHEDLQFSFFFSGLCCCLFNFCIDPAYSFVLRIEGLTMGS